MMRNNDKSEEKSLKNNIKYLTILMALSYFFLYIVLPHAFSFYYPSTNETTAFLAITLLLTHMIGGILVSLNIKDWLIGDFIWLALPYCYSAEGAYGGFLEWGIYGLMINIIILMVFQIPSLLFLWICKKLYKKFLSQ